jgi:hypothetical protein
LVDNSGGRERSEGGEVKKTSKSGFQEKTFLEVFRCGELESEVCWLTTVGGGGGGEVKKTSKSSFREKTFLEVFRCGELESEVSFS